MANLWTATWGRTTTRRPDAEALVNLAQRRMWHAEKSAGKEGGSGQAPPPPAAPAVPPAMDKLPPKPEPSGAGEPPAKPEGDSDRGSDGETPPDWVKDPARAYAEIQKLRQSEAARRTKERELEERLAAIESEKKAAAEKDLADKGEWQQIAEQREAEKAALEAKLAEQERAALRLRVGVAAGLPAELIDRLKGSTEAELTADAETLKSLVPQGTPKPPSTTTSVPGGQGAGLTYEERKRRHYGGSAGNPFKG